MASDVNFFVCSGRLTKNPELKTLKNDKKLLRFTVAGNEYYRANDMLNSKSNFIPITCWDRIAEKMDTMLKKGMFVVVEGKISPSTYQAKDGSSKMMFNFTANRIVPVFPPKGEEGENIIQEEPEEEQMW